MFKKMVIVLVLLALVLGLSGLAMAREKVDALSATATGLDWVSDFVSRLIASGEPAVVFGKHAQGAVKVSLVEGFLLEHLNITGGLTLANEEPANGFWGFEYTGWTEKSESGGIWKILSEIKIGACNERGHWMFIIGYVWREE